VVKHLSKRGLHNSSKFFFVNVISKSSPKQSFSNLIVVTSLSDKIFLASSHFFFYLFFACLLSFKFLPLFSFVNFFFS
jgi:hypothetical protein